MHHSERIEPNRATPGQATLRRQGGRREKEREQKGELRSVVAEV